MEFHIPLDEYIQICKKHIEPIVKRDFPEFYEELVGISQGAFYKGVIINVDSLHRLKRKMRRAFAKYTIIHNS